MFKKKFLASHLNGHGDIVGEELTRAETLRHHLVASAIDIGGELGYGVKTYVALKRTCNP